MIDTPDIEKRAELTRVQSIHIGATLGGITIATPADLEILSARLARGKSAVPPHVRDNPGVCFALCMQALEWRMPIMSVLNKSYVVTSHGVDRIAFESQLIHAVIERNAPIKGRLRQTILGEGDERRCKVWATFKGEKEPHEYTSETLAKLREARGRNEDKQVKGSPLWEHQPEVQLFYSASRTWARMFCPDVILGAYTPEDPWYSSDNMVDVTPQINGLAQRLRDAKAAHVKERGFDAAHVAKVIEGEAEDENPSGSDSESSDQRWPDQPGHPSGNQDDGGRSATGEGGQADGPKPAGSVAASAPQKKLPAHETDAAFEKYARKKKGHRR